MRGGLAALVRFGIYKSAGVKERAEDTHRRASFHAALDWEELAALLEAERRISNAKHKLDPYGIRQGANMVAAMGSMGLALGAGLAQHSMRAPISHRLLGAAGSAALMSLGVIPGSRFGNRAVDTALQDSDDLDPYVKALVEAHRPRGVAGFGALAGAVSYGLGTASQHIYGNAARREAQRGWQQPPRTSHAPSESRGPRQAAMDAQVRYVDGKPTITF